MRRRAEGILEGMGRVAIASVHFGRAPREFRQFRAVRGPDWVSVVVRAPLLTRTTTPTQEDARDWVIWQAQVFERAYLAAIPGRGARVRGESEGVRDHGQTQAVESEPLDARPTFTRQPSRHDLVVRITRAARTAGFAVAAITFSQPDRLAATARLTVSTRHRFAARFNAFYPKLNALADGVDGFAWQLHDRCGALVAQSAYGWYVNPGWECPEPGIIGPSPTRAACRRLAAAYPAC